MKDKLFSKNGWIIRQRELFYIWLWLTALWISLTTQTTGPPVNLVLGKLQTWVSLSLELITGTHPLSYPMFESGRFRVGVVCVTTILPSPLRVDPNYSVGFVQVSSSMTVNNAQQLSRETRLLSANSIRTPPIKSGLLTRIESIFPLDCIVFGFHVCI